MHTFSGGGTSVQRTEASWGLHKTVRVIKNSIGSLYPLLRTGKYEKELRLFILSQHLEIWGLFWGWPMFPSFLSFTAHVPCYAVGWILCKMDSALQKSFVLSTAVNQRTWSTWPTWQQETVRGRWVWGGIIMTKWMNFLTGQLHCTYVLLDVILVS